MISIEYKPWVIRGISSTAWMVYVTVTDSKDLSQIAEVKRRLNEKVVDGIVVASSTSIAIEKLGWNKLDKFTYYKIF